MRNLARTLLIVPAMTTIDLQQASAVCGGAQEKADSLVRSCKIMKVAGVMPVLVDCNAWAAGVREHRAQKQQPAK